MRISGLPDDPEKSSLHFLKNINFQNISKNEILKIERNTTIFFTSLLI